MRERAADLESKDGDIKRLQDKLKSLEEELGDVASLRSTIEQRDATIAELRRANAGLQKVR